MSKLFFSASLLTFTFCVGSTQGAVTNNRPVENPGIQDSLLQKKIYKKIAESWVSKHYEYVWVEVKKGIVTLTGSVKSENEKEAIEKEIRNMEGVTQLENRLHVLDHRSDHTDQERAENFAKDIFSSPADEQLNKKIRDQISRGWNWDRYKSITLKTSNGIVILAGRVGTLDDRKKLANEIQNIEGVKVVTNNLTVHRKQ